MLKNILNLDGAQQLTNNEQKTINGGITAACANVIANGCVPGPYSACLSVGGSYNSACRCCEF